MTTEQLQTSQARALYSQPVHHVLVMADGSSIHTQRWIEGLTQTGGWHVSLISMNPEPIRPEIGRIPGVRETIRIAPEHIRESGNNIHYLWRVPEVRRVVRRLRPDVITSIYMSSYGLIAALSKGSCPLVHFVVGDDIMIFPKRTLIHRLVTQWTLRSARFVISASRTMTDEVVRLGFCRKKTLTQQYGVSDWVIQRPVVTKSTDVICNRAWVPNSNIPYVLDLLGEVEAKSVIVGQVVEGNEALGARVEQAIKQLKVCENLPSLAYEQNIEQVARARFLMSLTHSEGASLSVMEAMALGTIPILSDTAPNREWVRHGQNGFLLPLDDRALAIERLRQALSLSSEEVRRMAELNREMIRERGSLTKNMKRVSDLLKVTFSPVVELHGQA